MCKNDEVKSSLYSKEEEMVRKPWKDNEPRITVEITGRLQMHCGVESVFGGRIQPLSACV